MKWEPDALAKVRETETNCSDFIYGASEYITDRRGRESVTLQDVETVIQFIEENRR